MVKVAEGEAEGVAMEEAGILMVEVTEVVTATGVVMEGEVMAEEEEEEVTAAAAAVAAMGVVEISLHAVMDNKWPIFSPCL